jgi:hypothetical protein
MRSANATNFYRKSGVAKGRDLLFLFRFSHTLYQPFSTGHQPLIFATLSRAPR